MFNRFRSKEAVYHYYNDSYPKAKLYSSADLKLLSNIVWETSQWFGISGRKRKKMNWSKPNKQPSDWLNSCSLFHSFSFFLSSSVSFLIHFSISCIVLCWWMFLIYWNTIFQCKCMKARFTFATHRKSMHICFFWSGRIESLIISSKRETKNTRTTVSILFPNNFVLNQISLIMLYRLRI